MWPNQAKCAVLLTFDFDAESLWETTGNHNTPTYMSRGEYGARVGVPRILALLERYHLPATFFIPGITAERHPGRVEAILAAGHEIGHHGYRHESPTDLSLDEERAVLEKGFEILEKLSGRRPRGYRSPAWDLSQNSLRLFQEYGFAYDSSMMADDFQPYPLLLDGRETGVVEIPVAWELDDAPHFMFNLYPYRAGMATPDQVYQIWAAEFDGAYAAGGVFTLTMHPQFIGRYHRLLLLERLIQYIAGHPGVWFATCSDVVDEWRRQRGDDANQN
jgi:peptidoglycan/xylan/chitin deacetylase (PgdA/CDA1 family)